MATNQLTGWIPDAVNREDGIDLLDAFVAPFFAAATFVLAGIATIGIDAPIEFYLDMLIYSAHGTEVSWAFIIAMKAIVLAWVSNGVTTREDLTDFEFVVVLLMVILNILTALVPAVSVAVEANWWLGFFMIGLNGGGFYALAWK